MSCRPPKLTTAAGRSAVFVDGVAMFNSWDAYTWTPNTSEDAPDITGYWNRDAYVNEGATFDPGYAHQQNTGTYHYHASPHRAALPARRPCGLQRRDQNLFRSHQRPHPTFAPPRWVADGFPVYGPYGYSNATNANSGIRRMISGYVIRNGQYGTSNLTLYGRTTIPQWAVRLYNVSSNQAGPRRQRQLPAAAVTWRTTIISATDQPPAYMQGVDFDLDEYNGRYCVTPEYPNGTYAYFVAIAATARRYFPTTSAAAITAGRRAGASPPSRKRSRPISWATPTSSKNSTRRWSTAAPSPSPGAPWKAAATRWRNPTT